MNLEVYKENFERSFIEATRAYYKAESEAFVASHSVSEYLRKAEERLKEEDGRVERYLHGDTRKIVRFLITVSYLMTNRSRLRLIQAIFYLFILQLISTCEDVLIRSHSELMWDEFQNLLDYDKAEGEW